MRSGERKAFIEVTKKRIYDRISPEIPNVYLKAVVKSINGIYRKMFIQGKVMDEIYDIYAVRVIVDTINDCYNVLGVIHDMFRPIPTGLKTIFPRRSPMDTNPFTHRCSAKKGLRLKCRSGLGRCTIQRNTASRRTGNTNLV